jgi:ParB-like chromosome segregation protein Spo0J
MSTTEHIAEDLRPLAQPIDLLKLLPGNPRRGDVEAVMRSYDRFGQRKPIVARRDGTVIAGNHQLQAAQRLGWSHIAVVWTDDDDLTAKAFALADNRTADLGAYDDADLRALIESVAIDPELLAAASYSLDEFLQETENDLPSRPPTFDVIDPDTMSTLYRCPSCNFEWSGSPRPGEAIHEPGYD